MIKKPQPFKDALKVTSSTALVVFVGALVVGTFNKALYESLSPESQKKITKVD